MQGITKKEFCFSKKKMFLGICVSTFLIIMSIILMIGVFEVNIFSLKFSHDKDYSGVLIGVVAIINFIIGLVIFIDYLHKLFEKDPAIIIDKDGIYLNINKSVLIRWNEIGEVFMYNTTVKSKTTRNIGIEPKVSFCFKNK